MKRAAKLIPILLTLLLLCVGAALPRITALALDRRGRSPSGRTSRSRWY